MIRLHANENPLGPSPAVIEATREVVYRPVDLTGINRYPDFLECELRAAFACPHLLPSSCAVPSCGASEIKGILPAALLTDRRYKAVVPVPADPLVPRKVEALGGTVVEVPLTAGLELDLDAMLDAVDRSTGFVFVPNPVDPTGTVTGKFAFSGFMTKMNLFHRNVAVVVDESYREYVEYFLYPDHVSYIYLTFSIVILRSFSFAHGLAGLRAGYALAPIRLATVLNGKLKGFLGGSQGWTMPEGDVNRLGEAAALACMKNEGAHLEKVKRLNREGRNFLARGLENLGCRISNSEVSFLFVTAGPEYVDIHERLEDRHILVKPGSDYGEDWSAWFRLSVGTMEESRAFLDAMADILGRRWER